MALIPWYQKCRCECSLSPLMFFPSRKGIWQLQRTITTLSLGNFTLDYVVLWPSGLTYNFQTSEDRREHPSGNPPGAWGTQHESSTWAGVGERQYSKAAVHTHCIRHTAKKTILDSLNQTVECKKHFYTIVCKTVALASLLPSVTTLSQTMSTRWLTTLKKLSREHQWVRVSWIRWPSHKMLSVVKRQIDIMSLICVLSAGSWFAFAEFNKTASHKTILQWIELLINETQTLL